MRPFLVMLALGWSGLAGADEVFLKSGGRLSGQVISEDSRTLVLEVGPGRISVQTSSVLRVERGTSTISAFRERASRLADDDILGWLSLAFWAQERDLDTQAHEALERVLRIDPQNAAANAALGRVLSNGRYVTVEESYRERGYVEFEGEWLTPAEHEARLRSRAAEDQAAAARQDLRVREAEARAREAEADARRAEAEAQSAWSYGGGWGWGWGWDYSAVSPPALPPPTNLVPPLRPEPRSTPLPPNPLTTPTHPSPPPPPPPQRARPRSR